MNEQLLQQLFTVIGEVVNAEGDYRTKATAIREGATGDAEVNLEEFLSWFDPDDEEQDPELAAEEAAEAAEDQKVLNEVAGSLEQEPKPGAVEEPAPDAPPPPKVAAGEDVTEARLD